MHNQQRSRCDECNGGELFDESSPLCVACAHERDMEGYDPAHSSALSFLRRDHRGWIDLSDDDGSYSKRMKAHHRDSQYTRGRE